MMFPLQANPATPNQPAAADGLIGDLWAALVASYGPAGPFYAIAAIGILIALIALPVVLRKQKDPLDRFSFKEERIEGELVKLRQGADSGNLQGLAPLLEPSNKEDLSSTRKDLRSAGYKDPSAVRLYFFAKAVLGLGLLCFGLILMFLIPDDPDVVFALLISTMMGLFGYFLPVYWVKRQIETRREDIQNSFPDAMDMMLVCIEGGQSLDQAMARVGQEMQQSSSPLAEEMEVVTHEFRAGKDRSTVLRDFAERCNVNDISSFVTVLIQSSQFGTSISQALRVYASEMRDKRLMRAEEKANVLPTKLTLGTMIFTVPPLILILVGPSFIQIIRSLSRFAG
ncbi:MAG: type II secretion system F family protein [Pseudomonadota bacterium]